MIRILVIDDSSFLRKMVCGWLKQANYEVLEAADGDEGLDKVASDQPDCILLDLAMPNLDGLEVLKALRERGCAIPVIVVTADVQKSTKQQCLDLGARTVINKPSNVEDLDHVIRSALTVHEGADR